MRHNGEKGETRETSEKNREKENPHNGEKGGRRERSQGKQSREGTLPHLARSPGQLMRLGLPAPLWLTTETKRHVAFKTLQAWDTGTTATSSATCIGGFAV